MGKSFSLASLKVRGRRTITSAVNSLTWANRLVTRALAVMILLSLASHGVAGPARMWFSLSGFDPFRFSSTQPGASQPQVPQLDLFAGQSGKLYLWAQPQTVTRSAAYSSSNLFTQLTNLSLQIDADGTSAGASRAVFNNPLSGTHSRFDKIVDSDHPAVFQDDNGPVTLPQKSQGDLKGLLALPLGVTTASGIGPNCVVDVCLPTNSGPAWLLGAVDIEAATTGITNFRLQIGNAGITYANEEAPSGQADPDTTHIFFGTDTSPNVEYNAAYDRLITKALDTPDAIVNVIDVLPGDYDGNRAVTAADYVLWRNNPTSNGGSGGYNTWRNNFGRSEFNLQSGDFNLDGRVDVTDYVVRRNSGAGLEDDAIWRGSFGETVVGGAAVTHAQQLVPEPNPVAILVVSLVPLLFSRQRAVRNRYGLLLSLRNGGRRPPARQYLAVFAALGLLAFVVNNAGAATRTWDGSEDRDFTNRDNWAPVPPATRGVAPVVGDIVVFAQSGAQRLDRINLNAGHFLKALQFQTVSDDVHLFDAPAGSSALYFIQLNPGNDDLGIDMQSNYGGNVTIDPALTLANNQVWNVQNDNKSLTVTRSINLEGFNLWFRGNGDSIINAAFTNGTHNGSPGRVIMDGTDGKANLFLNGSTKDGIFNSIGELHLNRGKVHLAAAATSGIVQMIFNGGTLRADEIITSSSGVTLNAQGIIEVAQGQQATFNGVVQGPWGINKEGNGKLTLLGANTYQGTTNVNDGTLEGTTATIKNNLTIASGAHVSIIQNSVTGDGTYNGRITGGGDVNKWGENKLTLMAGDNAYGGTSVWEGSIEGYTGSLQNRITVTGNTSAIFRQETGGAFFGYIEGTGRLVKEGAGGVELTQNSTHFGGTYINGGRIIAGADSQLGSGILQLANGAGFQAKSSFHLARPISMAGAGFLDSAGNTLTVDSSLSGAGLLSKTGTGSVTLTASNLAHTGGITVAQGTLNIDSTTNALPRAGTIRVNSGATLSLRAPGSGFMNYGQISQPMILDGGTVSFAPASTTDALITWLGDTTLGQTSTLTSNGGALRAGEMKGIIEGNGGLNVAGHIWLSGDNRYTGETRIQSGVLTVAHANALAGSTLNMATNDGGALSFRGVSTANLRGLYGTRPINLTNDTNGGVALSINTASTDRTYSGVLSGNGSLKMFGGGTLRLDGANTLTGGVTVDSSFLRGNSMNLGSGPLTLQNGGYFVPNTSDTLNQNIVLSSGGGVVEAISGISSTISGTVSGSGTLFKAGGGSLYLSGDNNFTGETRIFDGFLRINHTSAVSKSTVNLAGGDIGLFLFQNASTAVLGGLKGNRNLSLERTNGTTVSVSIGNNNSSQSYSGALSGIGSLTKIGSGTLTLDGSAVNTYTGGTVVSSGTLVLARSADLPTIIANDGGVAVGDLTINSGASVRVESYHQVKDSAAVTINGGTLEMTGSYVDNIRLALNSGHVTGTGTVGIRPGSMITSTGESSIGSNVFPQVDDFRVNVVGGRLTFTNTSKVTNSAPTQLLRKEGAGQLVLNGLTEHATTIIDGGSVYLNSTHNGSVVVNSNGKLGGGGTIGGNVTGSGRVAPGNSPGILTINGNYVQSPTSTLEIEVGGLTPGPGPVGNPNDGYDQLRVTGNASLGGRLEVPLIDPLKAAHGPPVGHPTINFLTAGSVTGQFSSVVSPGLDTINPSLAVEVTYAANGASLNFVPKKLNLDFNDASNDGSPTWEEVAQPGVPQSSWLEKASQLPATDFPKITHDLTIENNKQIGSSPVSQTLTVVTPLEQVYRATIGTGASPMNVVVGDGNNSVTETLNAVTNINVMTNGALRLNGGNVATAAVNVNGGMIEGSGTIDLVGTGTLSPDRTVTVTNGMTSPGSNAGAISERVGTLHITGNYKQGAGGVYEVDITGDNTGANNDKLAVTGAIDFGSTAATRSTLLLKVAELDDAEFTPGAKYTIATAPGGTTGRFKDIQIDGRDDIYGKVTYGTTTYVESNWTGNVTNDDYVDEDDAAVFAAVMLNPSTNFMTGPSAAGEGKTFHAATDGSFINCFDFADTRPTVGEMKDGDRVIDFFDVPGFVQAMIDHPRPGHAMSATQAYKVFEHALREAELRGVPEPAAYALVLFGYALAACWRRRTW